MLIFGWVSIAIATRRRRPGLVELLGYSPSPGLGVMRALASGSVGVSAGSAIAPWVSHWPIWLFLVVVVAATAALLVFIQALTERWSTLFPSAARRVANPQRWLFGRKPTADAGSGSSLGWEIGPLPEDDPVNGADGDQEFHQPPQPLTADEILNLDLKDIDMVRSISRMDDRDVKDIMVPRLDVDAIPVTSSLSEAVAAFASTRHTRLPVYGATMDEVVGIVHIGDVLPVLTSSGNQNSLADLMRDPEFVAENMAVDDLLHLMRAKSLQMAVVVDEYGGVEGLVTLEDVLEEIVGEIEDEFGDNHPDAPILSEDGSWILNATTPVEEVNRIADARINGQDVNTIGGYVYSVLGRMPAAGDVITKDGLQIEVLEMGGRRIRQLRLSLLGSPEPQAP